MRNLARLTWAAQEIAGVPRNPDKRSMPLRKVVERYMDGYSIMERLECGHVQRVRQPRGSCASWMEGIVMRLQAEGKVVTSVGKRRCRQCADEAKAAIGVDLAG